MIPKIIHYCWFGTSDIPLEATTYIQEWKILNPDWEIILWDEKNSPMELPYMQTAYATRNWANLSNLARLHALREKGGFYLDIDVKLVKPLDSLLNFSCVLGFEEGEEGSDVFWVNNAVFGAEQGHSFVNDSYNTLLEKFDGTESANLSSPRLTTELLIEKRGLKHYGHQTLSNVTLFPKEFFYPIHYSEAYKIHQLDKYIYPETIGVHIWARTWFSKEIMLDIIDNLSEENKKLSNQLSLAAGTDSGVGKGNAEPVRREQLILKSVIDGIKTDNNNLLKKIGARDITIDTLRTQTLSLSIEKSKLRQDLDYKMLKDSELLAGLQEKTTGLSRQLSELAAENVKIAQQCCEIIAGNKKLEESLLTQLKEKDLEIEKLKNQLSEFMTKSRELANTTELQQQEIFTLEKDKIYLMEKKSLFSLLIHRYKSKAR